MSNNGFSTTLKTELGPHVNKSKHIVIMRDFNLGVYDKDKKIVQNLCKMFSCNMCIMEPTTDNNSTLYLVFWNTDGISGTIETYWSDHKIVIFLTSHLV